MSNEKFLKLTLGEKTWLREKARYKLDWAIEFELGEFLYGLVRSVKSKGIIEVGTFEGFSTKYFAQALEKNEMGKIWTVDIKDFGAQKYLGELGKNIEFIIDTAQNALENVMKKNYIDFIFLDNGHSYQEVYKELRIVHKYLPNGGYIVGHDYTLPVREKTVKKAVDDFLAEYPDCYEKLIITSFNGLFILRKIKKNDFSIFYNYHKEQPIWIVGTDSSLDTFPDSFLEDKIGIALHLAYLKFPKATFSLANEIDRIFFLRQIEDYSETVKLFSYPLFGKNIKETEQIIKDFKNVFTYNLKIRQPKELISEVIRKIREEKSIDFIDYGTCLHAGIFSSILMGGNPINIIGCSHQIKDGKIHFSKAEAVDKKMRPNCKNFVQGFNEKVEEWTQYLIKSCLEQGIIVHRFKNYSTMKSFQILLKIKKVFDDLKVPILLHCGTLLGAYRDKEFISGDEDDIDLMIMEKDKANIERAVDELKKLGFIGVNYFKVNGKVECIGFKKEEVHIDIGVLNFKKDIAYTLGNSGVRYYPAYCFGNFGKLNFKGTEFDIPFKVEDFLEARYGKNWRIPISKKDWYAGENKKVGNLMTTEELNEI